MAQGLANDLRVRSAMDHDGTVKVGTYRMMASGPSIGGLIPHEHARALGAHDAEETDVYVNYELGVVMHKIPDNDGED